MKGVMAMDEKARKMLAEELLQLVEQRKIEVQEFRENFKKKLLIMGQDGRRNRGKARRY